MNSVKLIKNTMKSLDNEYNVPEFNEISVLEVLNFHKSFTEYFPTPLVALPKFAKYLGVDSFFVKDESKRFGLNAFKVLGGSYAMGKLLADRLNIPIGKVTRDMLASDAVRSQLGEITFCSATDGNHGRGVAWTAQQLRQKAVIYMPKGAAKERVDNIEATGAKCIVTDLNYDDAVRLANDEANKNGWLMVQDTAWAGYEDIPRWIMQGYATLMVETVEQLYELGAATPTHVFLQAGVGSFAGAALGFIVTKFKENMPKVVIVEPHQANCIYESMVCKDGNPHAVAGALDTLMAGLACGEPSTVSWGILRDYADYAISCPDTIAANGMRILSSPIGDDQRIISGESGAVTTGIVDFIMKDNAMKEELVIDADSKILVISTEGDTSAAIYRDVVWYGRNKL